MLAVQYLLFSIHSLSEKPANLEKENWKTDIGAQGTRDNVRRVARALYSASCMPTG